jgi:PAS domain S-box-containing protein
MQVDDVSPKTTPSQETYNLLQAILNGTSDGIYAKDIEGRYVLVNAAGASFVDSTVEQMLGEHYSTIVSPAEVTAISQEDSAVLTTGQSQVVETTGEMGGVARHYQTIKTPYRDADGNVLGIVSISRDVTEQKRAEAALGRSEEEYRAMFELAGMGNAQVDFWSGRILRANRKLCDMLGYSAEELLNKTFLDVTHPEDQQTNLDYFQRRQQGELDGYSLEKRYLRKDGSVLWGEMHTRLLRGPAAEPLYVIATVQDITAHKQAEAEQARLYAAEQEARAAAERGRQRASFLAAVSTALASSLDFTTTLLRVARLSVNSFATWCIIDLLSEGRIRRTAFAAHESELEPLLRELSEQYPIDPGGSHAIAQAIRNEKAMFVPVMPADYAERVGGGDARHIELLHQVPVVHRRSAGGTRPSPGRY